MYGKLVIQMTVCSPDDLRIRKVTVFTRYAITESEANRMAEEFVGTNFHSDMGRKISAHWIPDEVRIYF